VGQQRVSNASNCVESKSVNHKIIGFYSKTLTLFGVSSFFVVDPVGHVPRLFSKRFILIFPLGLYTVTAITC
jgi:hypothetical protein